MLFYNMKVWGD